MLRTLAPGAVHVRPEGLEGAIAAARDFGFGGLDFDIRAAASLGAGAAGDLFRSAGVVPAVFGLPVEWRQSDEIWESGLAELPKLAATAAALGCSSTATWVMPASNDRPLEENIAFHVKRFTPIAAILGEHGISLGLEFIGPYTLRSQFTHPFIHTQDGMLDLAGQIGPNVGLLLDAYHWYTSHGTVADLHRLTAKDVVYVHINDAPAGVAVDEQQDGTRCLPGATGVIDLPAFFDALRAINYVGPVAAEPFDEGLKSLPDDNARLAAVRAAFDKVLP